MSMSMRQSGMLVLFDLESSIPTVSGFAGALYLALYDGEIEFGPTSDSK